MKMSLKSPTPWSCDNIKGEEARFGWRISDVKGFTLANDLEEENAKHIVRVVNSFEKLEDFANACRYAGRDGVELLKKHATEICHEIAQ